MRSSFFTSRREKRLWIGVLAVVVAIFSTLFIGDPLVKWWSNPNTQAAIFLLGMILIGLAILFHAIQHHSNYKALTLLLGIGAVYLLFFLRLGLPERSHLIEYSVLAIAIHQAIVERKSQGKRIIRPALISFVLAFLIGIVDECMQIFLPHRVFDMVDILFNGIAVAMAIGAYVIFRIGKS